MRSVVDFFLGGVGKHDYPISETFHGTYQNVVFV